MGEKGIRKGVVQDNAWARLDRGVGVATSDWTASGGVKVERVHHWQRSPGDPGRAFNPETGQNAHYDPDKGQWTDSKTGEALTPPAYE